MQPGMNRADEATVFVLDVTSSATNFHSTFPKIRWHSLFIRQTSAFSHLESGHDASKSLSTTRGYLPVSTKIRGKHVAPERNPRAPHTSLLPDTAAFSWMPRNNSPPSPAR